APSPNRIVTVLSLMFAVERSGLPSRLKSPTATEMGKLPTATGELEGCENPPLPFPSRIVTVLALKFAVARSGVPSRLKSPTATDLGLLPVPTGEPQACEKPPAPSPSKIVTLLELMLETARSRLPSLLKSPTAVEEGLIPTATGEPGASEKHPAPPTA